MRQVATEYNVYKNHANATIAKVEELIKTEDRSFWLILHYQNGGSLFDLIKSRIKMGELNDIR